MATQTPATAPKAGGPSAPKSRIMRIGIVQGGRIVEERLIRKRENISIGWSSKATFAVPSEALPKKWLMFEAHPKGYIAHFADAMDARIAVGNEVISLAQLRQGGRLRKQGPSSRYLLDERSRGKVTVGDLSVLFQFVTPPPPQPRPQLPASVRGSFFTGMDWLYTSIASASFLAHLVFVLYLRSVDWPRKPDIEEIPDRFVQMVVAAKPPEPPKENVKKDESKPEDEGKKVEKRPAANTATVTSNRPPSPEAVCLTALEVTSLASSRTSSRRGQPSPRTPAMNRRAFPTWAACPGNVPRAVPAKGLPGNAGPPALRADAPCCQRRAAGQGSQYHRPAGTQELPAAATAGPAWSGGGVMLRHASNPRRKRLANPSHAELPP